MVNRRETAPADRLDYGAVVAWGLNGVTRRTPFFVVDDLKQAVAIATEHGDRLVLDLENTLIRYGSNEEGRLEAMSEAARVVARAGGIARLAFVTNGPFKLPQLRHDGLTIHTVGSARKPYVRLPPLRRYRSLLAGAAVYGDQPLTDGMLAHNLGGIWIQPRHAHEPAPGEPWWPQVMRRAGERKVERHFQRLYE